MANMARKEAPGSYVIGIWSVERKGAAWEARAFGPGTMGNGSPEIYPTLAAAHLALTGEAMHDSPSRRGRNPFHHESPEGRAWDAGDRSFVA